MKDIREFGRLRANPNARTDHRMVRLPACPEPTVCEDYYSNTVANTKVIASFVHEGVTVTLDTAIAVTDPDAIKAAIVKHLQENTTAQEFDVWVDVQYNGTALTFRHRGATTISRISTTAGDNYDTARRCNIKVYCTFTGILVGAVPNITIDGADEALANSPYAYSGNPVTDAATASTLEEDIQGALDDQSLDYKSATVEVSDELEAYVVTVTAIYGTTISSGSNKFTEGSCTQEFAA